MKINNNPAVSSSVRTKEVTKRAPRGLGKRKAEAEVLAAPQLIGSEMAGDKTTAASAPVPVATVGQNEALRSVVRLEVAAAEPDYSLPWQKGDPYYTSGSACVIESPPGKLRILTAAHVVANNTFVRAQRQDTARFFSATVVAINQDCDLALLEVSNPKFFDGLKPLQFVDTPSLQNTVVVFGYPEGGESLCATRGVVSRLELQQYQIVRSFKDEGLKLLTLQIDAAINPGNSGGPVLDQENKIVGVVFQKMGGMWTESVGYVIPTEIIRHFLTDVENGRSPQFCSAGFEYQKTDNDSLRKWAKLKKGQTGVMVTKVDELSSAKSVIQPGDVITRVEGVEIGNDGTVSLSESKDKENLRLSFEYFVTKKFVGEKLSLTLVRNGEEHSVEVTAEPRKYLIPPHEEQHGVAVPNYFIHAGLVFIGLNENYVGHVDAEPIVGRYYYQNTKRFEDEQVVVMTKILQDQVNAGFSQEHAHQLLSLNGCDIRNLRHLIDEVERCAEPFLEFRFDSGERIVLATQPARKATERILRKYGIRSAKSSNFLPVKAKATTKKKTATKAQTSSPRMKKKEKKNDSSTEKKEEELS